jgi:hypothetical protein
MNDREELHKFIVEKLGGQYNQEWTHTAKGGWSKTPNLDTYEGLGLVWGWIGKDEEFCEKFIKYYCEKLKLWALLDYQGLVFFSIRIY